MGNFWSDKNQPRKPSTSENKQNQHEWQKKQNAIRSGKIELHPEIKSSNQPLNTVKHDPKESKEAKRKRIQEARSVALKNILNKQK